MNNRIALLAALSGLFACTTTLTQAEDLKAYPSAESGFDRHVIRLPALPDEDDRKVELIPGKTIEVDCNRHWFGGSWSREMIPGWGYSYFLLADVSGPASTRMACPEDEPLRDEFVRVNIEDPMLRYNSRMPIVVYAPEGIEVRYRIWSAADEVSGASVE